VTRALGEDDARMQERFEVSLAQAGLPAEAAAPAAA
jgi:hypothetical protein